MRERPAPRRSTLSRLLALAYWLEPSPGRLRPAALALYLGLAGLFALGLISGLREWRRGQPRALLFLDVLACMSGLGAVALRLAAAPGYSARLWVAVPLLVAAALFPWQTRLRADRPGLGQGWRDLWAFRPPGAVLSPEATAVLLALHLLGLTIVARLLGWPAWCGPALLFGLLLPQVPSWLARRPPSALALNALAPLYLLAAAELGRLLAAFGRPVQPSQGALPLLPALALLGAYAWAYQCYTTWPQRERRALAWALAVLAGAAAFAWAAWAYLTLYARGVTGSDPYCYVQMAVDVARRGTLEHRFPLTLYAQALHISPEPLLHVGYRLPLKGQGDAPTVWPPGHSLLLGLAGLLGGDAAIYLGTPLMGLASMAATLWLTWTLGEDLEPRLRMFAGCLAAFLLGTSLEQLRWLSVHMADISAQLFSTLTMVLAWLAARRGRRAYWALSGIALAVAYWTRHVQLAMALPALALLVTAAGRSRRERLLDAAIFLGAALVVALPDLAYHQRLFGSPLHPESEELALYTLRALPATTAMLLRGWLATPELGYVAPFLLAGALALARCNRRVCLALGPWLVALWAVQAPYASLRLRDLLPALPALVVLAGYGAAVSPAWLGRHTRTGAVLLALGLVLLLGLRLGVTALVPARHNWNNFGYLWATQRLEFAGLASMVEPNAVVGSTLNDGPLDLYAGCETFRPAAWRPAELERFLRALWAEDRPVYLLEDGQAMATVLAGLRAYARLTPTGSLHRIPYYAPDGGSELRDVVLYRAEPGAP